MSLEHAIPLSMDDFPAQLRMVRRQRDVTQRQLAEQAKVSQQTISAIEKGKIEPSLSVLFAIALALGVGLVIGSMTKQG